MQIDQATQTRLLALLDREEIHDCLQRYARGVDRFDRALLLSAFHDDFLDEHGKFVGNREEFADWAFGQHRASHQSHCHYILNHRADIDGTTAHAETYFIFTAMNRQGKPLVMGGGRYIDRLEKRDGQWKIAARVTLRDWGMIDHIPDVSDLSAFTSTRASLSAADIAFMNQGRGTARDESDASYDRPLRVDPARRDAYLALKAAATT